MQSVRSGVSDKLKAVLDTQIFLRAAINSRSACAKLSPKHWRGYYTLYISDAVEAEITDVLNRPGLRAKFPQITDLIVADMINTIHEYGQRVQPEQPIEAVSRDPKDDMFLACAKAAQADYLVSEDNDLLVIGQHHTTQIVNVAAFLAVLEKRRNENL
jgi:putative PIN family toxin of toxin-antitoxin system